MPPFSGCIREVAGEGGGSVYIHIYTYRPLGFCGWEGACKGTNLLTF